MEIYHSAQDFITDLQFNAFLSKHVPQIRNCFNCNPINSIALELLVLQPLNETGEHPSLSVQGIADSTFSDDRWQCMRQAGQQVYQQGLHPVATFLICEAWVKQFDEDSEQRPVEQCDDKKEILMVTGMTLDKRTNLAIMDIQRVKGNKIWLQNPTFQLYDSSSVVELNADLLAQFYVGYLEQIESNRIKGISDRTPKWWELSPWRGWLPKLGQAMASSRPRNR